MAKNKRVVKDRKARNSKPIGVKIVSVLFYIIAVLYALFGLFIIIGSSAIVSYLITSIPELETVEPGTLIVLGIALGVFLIGLSILFFFVARGIWKLKPWARVAAIILAILGLASTIISILGDFQWTQIFNLIIDGGIAIYLLFNKDAKRVFK